MSSFLLLTVAQGGIPNLYFTGAGDVTLGVSEVAGPEVATSGTGDITIGGLAVLLNGPAVFTGTGDASVTGERVIVQEMGLSILDATLIQAPTSVTAVVSGGWPLQPVTLAIDGTVIYSDTLDSAGGLGPISLAVDTAHGAAGTHTLTVTGTGAGQATSASATFTLAQNPPTNPRTVGPDADPLEIPGALTATGVRRWVLQDLMPGGLGSWVMPRNPISMSALPFNRTLSQEHSTALEGMFHVTESGAEAHPFSFTGFATTQTEHDKLLAYATLKRRFYLIDHRNRAWVVAGVGVELTPRKRYADMTGALNDWGHDYTMRVLIHTGTWKVPQ